ncbi:MAG: pilus assembly protein PilM [Candidatus Omnitrophica bacterium]|nr:pilus assembly protein PilM [Candidatus Omnitrophota bacterium]
MRKAQNSLGIYLEEGLISFVYLSLRENEKVKLISCQNVKLDAGVIKRGLISKPQVLASVLKKFHSEIGVKPSKVSVSIAGKGAITRVIDLPQMPEIEIIEALKGEVNKYVLLGVDNSIIDYSRISDDKVYLVAIKKKTATTIVDASENAELDLKTIEINSFSVLRALLYEDKEFYSKRTLMVVLISASRIDFNILKGGVYCFSHNSEDVKPQTFDHQLKMVKAYWDGQFPGDNLEKIIIFSDSDEHQQQCDGLSQSIGTNVEVGKINLLSQQNDGGSGCAKASAFGVALRKLGCVQSQDINLVPREKIKRDLIKRNVTLSFCVISATLFLWFALSLLLSGWVKIYQKKTEIISQKLKSSSGIFSTAKEINNRSNYFQKDIRQKQEFINQLSNISWAEILDDLANLIPHSVWLNEIKVQNENKIIIKGESFSQDELYKYISLLRCSKYFNGVKLNVVENRSGASSSKVIFTMSCFLADKEQKSETQQ